MSLKKFFVLGLTLVLLVTIPVTVYFIQQQQEDRSRAAPATVISLRPTSSQNLPISKKVGDIFDLEIYVNPGTNIVNNIFLEIVYDQTKLATEGAGIEIDRSVIPSIINEAQYKSGNIYIELSAVSDPIRQIQAPTSIGKVQFKAKATTGTIPTQVSFGPRTNAFVGGVLTGQADIEPYNVEGGTGKVLRGTEPAFVAIAEAAALSPTPTGIPATSPQPTASIFTTPTPIGKQPPNQPPVCSTLNIDRATSGIAPFSVTFTASGNDIGGTINKATFNFGDGPVQDVTQAVGIGTQSVNVQIAHTYTIPGTYSASVIFTDDKGAISSIGSCIQTITVNEETPTEPSPTQFVVNPTIPPVVISTSPGPGRVIVGIGAAGVILTVLGAILFFTL